MLSEMSEKQKDCQKWMEDIYWNHFKSHSFNQSLTGDFRQQLTIPSKFSEKSRGKLPDSVALIGPSGATWNVGLVRDDEALLFKHGWGQFAKDHSLQENDILVFTYNRDSCFQVLIFDHLTFCEKEASYFVRKCETAEPNNCPKKRKEKERESSVENASHNSSVECVGSGPLEKSTDDSSHRIPRGQLAISEVQRKTRTKWVYSRRPLGSNKASTSDWGVKTRPASDRTLVDEDQKARALLMAEAALTAESFLRVMRSSQVHKLFYVGVPKKWLNRHLSSGIKKVILRVKDSTWVLDYKYYNSGCYGRFDGGWEKFVADNKLKLYDVCVFKYVLSEGNTGIIDVTIFRAVPEEIPPTEVSPGSGLRLPEMEVPTTRVTLMGSGSGSGKEGLLVRAIQPAGVALDSGSGQEGLERAITAEAIPPTQITPCSGSRLASLAEVAVPHLEVTPGSVARPDRSERAIPPSRISTSSSAREDRWLERDRKRLHQELNLNE